MSRMELTFSQVGPLVRKNPFVAIVRERIATVESAEHIQTAVLGIFYSGHLAQTGEQLAHNQKVRGSSP